MEELKNNQDRDRAGWLQRYKKTIILSTVLVLAAVIAVVMVFIGATLRSRLIQDSRMKTEELAGVIELSLRHLMTARNPGKIQQSLEVISAGGSSIVNAFILDNQGRIAYSSRTSDIGARIDRFCEPSCTGCHAGAATLSQETATLLTTDGGSYLRCVKVIRNNGACFACHPPSSRTVGKLIIDRSMLPTSQLITAVMLILAISGVLSLAVLVPFIVKFLSRGVDKYISEILFKSSELSMLYAIVKRLSKTIELEELKQVVIDIVRDLYRADEVHILLPKGGKEYGGVFWSNKDNKIDRRVVPDQDPYRDLILDWLDGGLLQERLVDGGRTVVIPLEKGGTRLGMIIATRSDRLFNDHDLELVRAMGSHISVALENASLYRIAITDELTGLYSKRHFRTMIEKKFELYEKYGEKLTLLILDIDDFKKVNDTYGHPAGDSILREVASRVMNTTREGDLDFRYGGEEFIVLLPATADAGGVYVAERICEQINSAGFDIGETRLRITVSIGVACVPEHAVTIRDLVSEADKALYEAKKTGKNRVVLSRNRPV
ncbi:MAG: sensor domain-containing diguanylate cyclase [Nitrospirota bacterium]|nr:sensor domain-containing diguanylate cyclase [Nitrospirota bacterium]